MIHKSKKSVKSEYCLEKIRHEISIKYRIIITQRWLVKYILQKKITFNTEMKIIVETNLKSFLIQIDKTGMKIPGVKEDWNFYHE